MLKEAFIALFCAIFMFLGYTLLLWFLLMPKIKMATDLWNALVLRVVKLEEAPPTPPEEEFEARVAALESWVNAQINSSDMAEKGRLGQQARQENAQQRKDALREGQNVLLSNGSMEEKKGQFIELIKKYPKVAYGVAQTLNRQYGISKFLGISEAELMQTVLDIASKASGSSQEGAPADGGVWYPKV